MRDIAMSRLSPLSELVVAHANEDTAVIQSIRKAQRPPDHPTQASERDAPPYAPPAENDPIRLRQQMHVRS